MGSYSRTIVVGNITKDAEKRATPGGAIAVSFTVATNEVWKDKGTGEKKERAEFHRVTFWGKGADAIAQYLTKGRQVAIEGKNQTDKWTDKNGVDRYTTSIKADRVVLLGSNGGGERAADAAPVNESDANADVNADDIPFAWLLPFVLPVLASSMFLC